MKTIRAIVVLSLAVQLAGARNAIGFVVTLSGDGPGVDNNLASALYSGSVQRGVAMLEHQELAFADAAQRDAEEIADANVDRHPHAVDGTVQHDAFAVKLDLPHAVVGAAVVRAEADGQRKWVEPQCTARPGGIDPACCCLTPHGFSLPAGYSRSLGESMPEGVADWLKKAG